MTLKKTWITPFTEELVTLSLESENQVPDYDRLQHYDCLFPANPTLEHPLRHVVVLGLLDEDDLRILYETIGVYLDKL